MPNNKRLYYYGIPIAALLELGMLTIFKKSLGAYISPFILLFSGLFVGIFFMHYFIDKEVDLSPSYTNANPQNKKWIFGLSIFGLLACAILLGIQIHKLPIDFYDPKGSDVIPQIGIMVDRFLSGIFPYQWISEWTFKHNLYPTYLPMTWLPFAISDVLHFDYRWLAFGALCIPILWYQRRLLKQNISHPLIVLLSFAPFFFLLCFMITDREGIFRYSIETLIAGYYLMLALALLSRHYVLIGVCLSLCLLSRYSVVLWVPLFVLIFFLKEKKYKTLGVLITIGYVVLFIYIIPFWLKDPTIFSKGFDYHTDGAIQAWKVAAWQDPGQKPFNIYKGMGFACYYNEFLDGELAEKVNAYRYTHLLLSLLTVGILGLFFLKLKNRINHKIFLLASLKIYLVVFYNFIQIPFAYLFLVPVFLSIPIIALVLPHFQKTVP